MQKASRKFDHFYFNCYEKHIYKDKIEKLTDILKDEIANFTEYFFQLKY